MFHMNVQVLIKSQDVLPLKRLRWLQEAWLVDWWSKEDR